MKVAITVTHEEVREAVTLWLKEKGVDVEQASLKFTGDWIDSKFYIRAEIEGAFEKVVPNAGVYR